ncbi:MAG TPA: hypothetical protein VKB38_15215 [Terracidiphilus sp.]|nr:hypothetical protein [Terracidiphilus sp.]
MSGLLNRMAKRAAGRLDGVQPLLAPHYAPRSADPRAGAFAQEVPLEIETPAPRQQRQLREAISAHESAPETSVAPARPYPASTRRAVDSAPAASPAPRSESIASRAEPARAIAPEPAQRADAEEISPSRVQRQKAPPILPIALSRLAREPKPIPDSGDAPVFAGPPTEIIPRNEAASGHKSGEIEPINITAKEELSPARSALRIPPEDKLPQPPPRAQAARPAQSAEPSEQKTEIHITIGSIELRAPRPEPKAPRAPFRPRVTLDEFLRRGQGGRS